MTNYPLLCFLYYYVNDAGLRSEEWLRWREPAHLWQYRNVTVPNRYSLIFRFVQQQLMAQQEVRLLSFGCATGDEAFTLRAYFPTASLKGIAINPRNIAIHPARQRHAGDAGVHSA
jgi:hypothetical protein